jgi:hypothetical protein
MKSIRFLEMNGYRVVYGVSQVSIDPEETKIAISEALKIPLNNVPFLENLNQLIEQYAVYPKPMPGEKHVDDEKGDKTVLRLMALGEHEMLTLEDETIPNWVGTKYHLKTNGIWTEVEIADVGIAVPEGAAFPDALTKEQRKEIADQREAARIAALSPEARIKEKEAQLTALADEAIHLKERAHIQGTEFDSVAWYQEHKASIEAKYT